jgi:hypothetical protein
MFDLIERARVFQMNGDPVFCRKGIINLLFAEGGGSLNFDFGDGVPLITARAGLMTPADRNVRWVLISERPAGGFLLLRRASGLSGYEHSGNKCAEI